MTLNLLFTALYVFFIGGAVVVEAIGVRRRPSGDTITEHWRWLDTHFHGPTQWFFRVGTAGLLVWTLLHLAGVWA